jgi:hypothetical protein
VLGSTPRGSTTFKKPASRWLFSYPPAAPVLAGVSSLLLCSYPLGKRIQP